MLFKSKKVASPPPSSEEAEEKPPVLPNIWMLVPSAGTGQRSGAAGPKQYQVVAGLPIIEHTVRVLNEVVGIQGILVVTAPQDKGVFQEAIGKIRIQAIGGPSRADTVKNGLRYLLDNGASGSDWVLVHDAVRCLVQSERVEALIAACMSDAVGGLLATPVVDTLKSDTGHLVSGLRALTRVDTTLTRHGKWLAQTPQMFKIGVLVKALKEAPPGVTDEASAVEAMGLSPLLVDGGSLNIKVTYPQDFELAEAILTLRNANK